MFCSDCGHRLYLIDGEWVCPDCEFVDDDVQDSDYEDED